MLSQRLRVETTRLFLHGAEGTATSNCRQFALSALWLIQIGCEFDAEAVLEGHFLVSHLVALWEHLVPLLS